MTPLARDISARLAAALPATAETHFVGGCLRDWLLYGEDEPVKDLDLVTDTDPLAIAEPLAVALEASPVALDEERRTLRLARLDVVVDIAFRAGTLEQDLRRRDFRVNAIAAPLTLEGPALEGLVDPLGGRYDLRERRLRLCAPTAIVDDPLRALRGVRLESAHGLRLDAEAEAAIRAASPRLASIAGERVREELFAALSSPDVTHTLRRLEELRLLPGPFRWVVPGGVGEAIASAGRMDRRADGALAAYLETDLGCRAPVRALALLGVLATEAVASDLRLSRREGGFLRRFRAARGWLAELCGTPGAAELLEARRAWSDALPAAALASPGENGALAEVAREALRPLPEPLLPGDEIARLLSLAPGPEIGRWRERLRAAQELERVNTPEDARRWLVEAGQR